jgi:EpsI family protein
MDKQVKARLFSIGLLAASLVLMRYPETPLPAGAPEKRLAGFPMTFEGWKGNDDPFDAAVMAAVDTDDDLHRKYTSDLGSLWLYVGYYGTKKGGRTGHLPHHCYPAAGYRIVDLGREKISFGNGLSATVNRILTERNGKQTLALYWVHSGDQEVMADGLAMNLSRLRRRLTKGRDDGAFIRISSNVTGSVEATLKREKVFAAEVLNRIGEHWPVERTESTSNQYARASGRIEKL